MRRVIIIELLAFVCILLFAYAAFSKVLDYGKFAAQVGQSPLLTGLTFLPPVVIVVELGICVLLMLPRWRELGFYLFTALMVVFTFYILAILKWSPYLPCSCGGVLEKLGWEEHLVFNVVFCGVGFTGWKLHKVGAGVKHTMVRGVTLVLAGMVVTGVLIGGAQRYKKLPGSFVREFPPHLVIETDTVMLKYNSYYIAGMSGQTLYLGNYTAPLHVMRVNQETGDTSSLLLRIAGIESQKFWSLRLKVDSPYYYLMDGAVPVVFRGSIESGLGNRHYSDSLYFRDAVPVGSNSMVLKSLSGKGENVLGKMMAWWPYADFRGDILRKHVDGVFCTDGILLYDRTRVELLYVHAFRNEVIILDTALRVKSRQATLDTNRVSKVKTKWLERERSWILAEQPMRINLRASVSGGQLLVHSGVRARNESEEAFMSGGVIDVYELPDMRYRYSFYLYDLGGERLTDFAVEGRRLVALYGFRVKLYEFRAGFRPGEDIVRVQSGMED